MFATLFYRQYYMADPWAAIAIAFMIFGTMFPMSAYTGKILLQVGEATLLVCGCGVSE